MSTSRVSVGNGNEVQLMPSSLRKIVQSLKEITSCSEAEIYATLKDCNMDPNEAVNCLLSQDHFHEVKSKREKKKEGKDTSEGRPHGAGNSSTQGSKSGGGSYLGRGGSTHFSGRARMSSLSSTHGIKRCRGPQGLSDGYSADNKGSSRVIGDDISSGIQPSQSAWVSVSGQMSTADIVRMGGPHNKEMSASNAPHNNNIQNDSTFHESGVPFYSEGPREAYAETFPSINQDYKAGKEDQETLHDNIENSAVRDVEFPSISSREIMDDDLRGASISENNLYSNMNPNRPQAREFEHHEIEDPGASVSSVTRNLQQLSVEKDDRELPSDVDAAPFLVIPDHLQVQIADCSYLSFGSYRSGPSIAYSLGTIETNLKRQQGEVDNSPVGHPDSRNYGYYDNSSTDVVNENSLHRIGASVGSYDAPSASQREELKPETVEINLERRQSEADISSRNYDDDSNNSSRNAVNDNSFHGTGVSGASYDTPSASQWEELKPETVEINSERRHSEADFSSRNYDYCSNIFSRNAVNDNSFHGTAVSGASYDTPFASQSEELKPENANVARGNQYLLPNYNNAHNFVDDQQLKPAFPQRGPEMQNRASFSDIMSFKSSWPSSNNTSELIEPQNHGGAYSKPSRKFDLQEMHALNAKLGFFSSNVGGPVVSVSEALKLAAMARPAPQNLTSGSLFPLRPFARPTPPPLGRSYTNNTTDYPFLRPQSYGYMPPSSAFQQTVAGNNNPPSYHQSIAAEILGNSPPAAMNDYDTDFSFDDVSSFQYKANNRHLISQQQNNNENSSAMWRLQHGSNSRTMSAVPASSSTYYNNYQRQQQNEQHPSEYRQGCHVSQNYEYPDFYRSQTGMSRNQQSWNPRYGSLGVSQRQPNQSQFWLENY